MKYVVLLALVAVASCVFIPHMRRMNVQMPVLPVGQADGVGCQLCELAVRKYETSADKDATQIKKDFDDECKKLLKNVPFGTLECKKYVDSKLDPIIKELESGTAPQDVCKKLGECK